MALVKLNHEETLLLSKKLEELTKLHQEAISRQAAAYQYDWQKLDQAIWQAVLEYRHILNTDECVSEK